ncbi:MAG: GNAT family N-acetyltransferase [Thermoplasmata archaeon]|nr:MAG: GNAT family N-acetyltransferase [Thermoplasmata archaeon]
MNFGTGDVRGKGKKVCQKSEILAQFCHMPKIDIRKKPYHFFMDGTLITSKVITNLIIRKFQESDLKSIIEILQINNQLTHPDVDGPEAMIRVSKNTSSVFLIAEINGKVVGSVRGVYDGSRALIHQITVHPDWQKQGIGSELIKDITREFKNLGAPSVSVTAGKGDQWDSIEFFKKLGFTDMPIKLMVNFNIDELIEK